MTVSTRVLKIDSGSPELDLLEEAASVIRQGGLVAFATETVYGLGADATNPVAVARIFEAKGRPALNPLIVHVRSAEMARECVSDWPDIAARLARRFWPGPLTMVLPRSDRIPDAVTAGQATVGLRVPRPKVARELIKRAGVPIAAPSANRSTGVSPTLASHVLKDLGGSIEMILDSGQTEVGLESTVIDLTTRQPRILRPGPISATEIEHRLGSVRIHTAPGAESPQGGPLTSPGQLSVHYAPRARTLRVDDPAILPHLAWPSSSALVVFGNPDLPAFTEGSGPRYRVRLGDPATAMHELYAILHLYDGAEVELIVLVPPPDHPDWHALRDRIWRASRPWDEASC